MKKYCLLLVPFFACNASQQGISVNNKKQFPSDVQQSIVLMHKALQSSFLSRHYLAASALGLGSLAVIGYGAYCYWPSLSERFFGGRSNQEYGLNFQNSEEGESALDGDTFKDGFSLENFYFNVQSYNKNIPKNGLSNSEWRKIVKKEYDHLHKSSAHEYSNLLWWWNKVGAVNNADYSKTIKGDITIKIVHKGAVVDLDKSNAVFQVTFDDVALPVQAVIKNDLGDYLLTYVTEEVKKNKWFALEDGKVRCVQKRCSEINKGYNSEVVQLSAYYEKAQKIGWWIKKCVKNLKGSVDFIFSSELGFTGVGHKELRKNVLRSTYEHAILLAMYKGKDQLYLRLLGNDSDFAIGVIKDVIAEYGPFFLKNKEKKEVFLVDYDGVLSKKYNEINVKYTEDDNTEDDNNECCTLGEDFSLRGFIARFLEAVIPE